MPPLSAQKGQSVRPARRAKGSAQSRGPLSPKKAIVIVVILILAIALGLVLAVYLSLSQAIITLTPKQQPISTTFSLKLAQNTIVEDGQVVQLAGTLFDRQIQETKQIAQLDKQEIDAQAGGTVKMVNGRDGTIRLVKNTQLKPEDRDTIFRIQSDVAIPPGGELEVNILADESGEIGNIPPTKFEIIKLFDGWKQDVYATSDEPMSGGKVVAEVLTENQIQAFRDAYRDELRDKVLTEIESEHPDLTFPPDGISVEVNKIDANAEAGERVESVELTADIRMVALAFQEHALLDVALQRLKQEVPEAYEFLGVTPDSFGYTIDSYDIERGTAIFTVSIDGVVLAMIHPDDFDHTTLQGRDALETANYFEQFEEMESVDVYFAPFWTTKIPRLESHTEIVVEKPLPIAPEPEAIQPPEETSLPDAIPASSVESNQESEVEESPSSDESLPDLPNQ